MVQENSSACFLDHSSLPSPHSQYVLSPHGNHTDKHGKTLVLVSFSLEIYGSELFEKYSS